MGVASAVPLIAPLPSPPVRIENGGRIGSVDAPLPEDAYLVSEGRFRTTHADAEKRAGVCPHINVRTLLLRAAEFAIKGWGEK